MKNIFLTLILVFMTSVVWSAKPNNIVPIEILAKTSNEDYDKNNCMGMRLTKDIIITAAHCITDTHITNHNSPLYIDFQYRDSVKEWVAIISNDSLKDNSGSNAYVYLYKQNFTGDSGERVGDLALIKINNPINIVNITMSDKNVKNLPPQFKNMIAASLKNEQKKYDLNYKSFMSIPLDNYKVFALPSSSDKVPEFFKTMKAHSYVSPCDEKHNCNPIVEHTGTFEGISSKNPKVIGWKLRTQPGESGSPILDTQNKRFFGAVSGANDTPEEYFTETMRINEEVCTFLGKLNIKCEFENVQPDAGNQNEKKRAKGQNVEKPIIKPNR